MRYSLTIFVGIIAVVVLGLSGYSYWLYKDIHHQNKVIVEDSLVDFSNLLASYLSSQIKSEKLNTIDFNQAFKNLKSMDFQASIFGVPKNKSSINFYITDERGVVLYDSQSEDTVGKDFSKWNDVLRTLKGEYGARTSRSDPSDPLSSVLYVAAPIQYENHIIGVISVSKSEESLSVYGSKFKDKYVFMLIIFIIGAIIIAAIISFWLTRPVDKLMQYAQRVTQGQVARPPQTAFRNFKSLGEAFDKMRISLAGKKQIENYAQSLTHELKSPLVAIKFAAEQIGTNIPQDKKDHLLGNIEADINRASKLLDELLEIAKLENQSSLDNIENLSLKELISETKNSLSAQIKNKSINFEVKLDSSELTVRGDRKLIQRILNNLILNAIAFSPPEGKVLIEAVEKNNRLQIFVRDQGDGIPDYAKEKIYERFFSLARPSGEKSSGLGLAFVKEAITLHSGKIQLDSPTQEMCGANFKISFN
jgi:two-component system, OmpR family, sensor histidine kinase CreC